MSTAPLHAFTCIGCARTSPDVSPVGSVSAGYGMRLRSCGRCTRRALLSPAVRRDQRRQAEAAAYAALWSGVAFRLGVPEPSMRAALEAAQEQSGTPTTSRLDDLLCLPLGSVQQAMAQATTHPHKDTSAPV